MNGIILIDKEQGWTSQDAVAKLRGILHERRIGHAGTLDPLATGLLVVMVGRATRACSYAEAETKEYIAALRLGITTDTQDITGHILREAKQLPNKDAVIASLKHFSGELEQIPPMYSAIKVNGQKLYDIARRGGEIERKPRKITIFSLEYLGKEDDDYLLKIQCSKGTYIRTLCHDIGEYLGCGACMASLRRVRCGAFSVSNACKVNDATSDRLLPLDLLFSHADVLNLDEKQEKRCRCGNHFMIDAPDGDYRFYSSTGEFLSYGHVEGTDAFSEKSFFEV